MSFSRAKITRFNEATSNTPSPADYNVKLEKNVKGAIIPKGERFNDKSPVRSECGSSAVSTHSSPCFRTPTLPKKKKTIFTLSSRKTKPTDLFSKSKSKKHLSEDITDDDLLDLEALKDKIVECNNKDVFIKDLTEQIEEMKAQLNDLECQKEQLSRERYKYEEQCSELRMEHKITMQNTFMEYDTETNELKQRIYALESDLVREQEAVKHMRADEERFKAEYNEKIAETLSLYEESQNSCQKQIDEKEKIIIQLKQEIIKLEECVSSMQKEHDDNVALLQKKHKEEIVDLEFTMLKSITETQNLLDSEKAKFEKQLKAITMQHTNEKSKILEESTAKIKQIEEDAKEANVLADIQMQERCKDIEMTWKLTLEKQQEESAAILKECQAISEYSITQCEWEKNEIKNELSQKVENLQKYERDNADLNIALQEMELKYKDLIEDMEHLKQEKTIELEKCKQDVQEILQQKKLYEISITKAHDIIDTLKKRLLHSDHDVEQLKSELEACEVSKLDSESRLNQLKEELYIAERHNEEIEYEYHETLKQADDRIAALEIELVAKVEEYRESALKQIDVLVEQIHQKESDLQDILEQLHCEHAINKKAHTLIDVAQTEIEEMSTYNQQLETEVQNIKKGFVSMQNQLEEADLKISGLEVENGDLRQEIITIKFENDSLKKLNLHEVEVDSLLKQLQQMQEKSDSYSQYCDYYKHKATEYEKDIEELEGINKKYIEQSGKYDSLLQKYELLQERCTELEKKTAEQDALIGPFREQLEAYDMERSSLVSQKAAAENEARTMGFKYAQLLGHQNQKQKIKHMMDLKAKNYDLVEEKKELELKLKSQTKTIEKLSKQLSTIQLHSPRKSKIHVAEKENVSSPNRTLNNSRVESPGPLKERN